MTSRRVIDNDATTSNTKCRNTQLIAHLTAFELLPELQLAYRTQHSTETAVLKVLGEILHAIDGGDLVALTLLDLSAAFDTVDHTILLRILRLKVSYGMRGSVLSWFASYLNGRTQFVRCGTKKSTPGYVPYSVPQGWSLDRSCSFYTLRTY